MAYFKEYLEKPHITGKNIEFDYKMVKDGYILSFNYDGKPHSIKYIPYFQNLNGIEVIRMGFIIDDYIGDYNFTKVTERICNKKPAK